MAMQNYLKAAEKEGITQIALLEHYQRRIQVSRVVLCHCGVLVVLLIVIIWRATCLPEVLPKKPIKRPPFAGQKRLCG